jgi:hypothetical protein
MGNQPEALMPPSGEVRLQLRFGDEVRTFTGENTYVRRFQQGGGEYDHCVFITPEEQIIAFTPSKDAMEEFIRLGFPVRDDETIDQATIEHYARVQAAHVGEEGIE